MPGQAIEPHNLLVIMSDEHSAKSAFNLLKLRHLFYR
jgi:hypothetical protein